MDETYFPTTQEWFLQLPLYSKYPITDENIKAFQSFASYSGSIDTYCPECGKDSIFTIDPNGFGRNDFSKVQWDYFNYVDFVTRCSRDSRHIGRYSFKLSKTDGLMKVGQYPSLADADSVKIRKYRKVLSKEQLEGFTIAVRLASAGVGAGAVVYLRRIFESLIEEAHQEASKDKNWIAAHTTYKTTRVADKVKALKSYLPSYLVEHHTMYSVLSSGVHDMSEQECNELFPVLKIGIEFILKQKIQKKEELESIAELKKMLSNQSLK